MSTVSGNCTSARIGGVKPACRRGVVERLALEPGVRDQPVARVEHFLRIGRGDQQLRQHGIRIQRDGREQFLERLGCPGPGHLGRGHRCGRGRAGAAVSAVAGGGAGVGAGGAAGGSFEPQPARVATAPSTAQNARGLRPAAWTFIRELPPRGRGNQSTTDVPAPCTTWRSARTDHCFPTPGGNLARRTTVGDATPRGGATVERFKERGNGTDHADCGYSRRPANARFAGLAPDRGAPSAPCAKSGRRRAASRSFGSSASASLRQSSALAYYVHSVGSRSTAFRVVAASGPGHPISLHSKEIP